MKQETGRTASLCQNKERAGSGARAPRSAETRADGLVHLLGVPLGFVGFGVLLVLALQQKEVGTAFALMVYGLGLVLMLSFSAAYNSLRASRWAWLLRRFDHASIFLMIAGSYTPLLVARFAPGWDLGLMLAIWTLALAGVALKILWPGRLERLALALYLGMGWLFLIALVPTYQALSGLAFGLLLTGGLIYTVGVLFHLAERLPFQRAIWHALVLVAAACHFSAILLDVAMV
ncbi:PAQR family membrane homeostasis protein TrhA [Rhodovibrionaceae bacterium A322]